MTQGEGPHGNKKVHRPHRIATASAMRMSISQLLLEHVHNTASRLSHLVRSVPSLDARRRPTLFSALFSLHPQRVLNNWRASWNTQRSAIRVSWYRDSASGL